jgi:hypothetical protein
MEAIKALLEQQPLMALFLTIASGYLVGEINVKGFSPICSFLIAYELDTSDSSSFDESNSDQIRNRVNNNDDVATQGRVVCFVRTAGQSNCSA